MVTRSIEKQTGSLGVCPVGIVCHAGNLVESQKWEIKSKDSVGVNDDRIMPTAFWRYYKTI